VAERDRPPEQIEAPGLSLRRHRVGDAAAIAAAMAESLAEMGPWLPWADERSATVEAQRRRLEEAASNWERDIDYVYVVLRPRQDRVLGCVGLHRRVGPKALEIGYWLRTGETGQGTMTTAVQALTDVALGLPGIQRVEIHCDEANHRSAAVPRRLGFELARTEDAPVKAPGETGRTMTWVLERAMSRRRLKLRSQALVASLRRTVQGVL
jgi:RimJ/RimL family protein N-acetyltransferase